MLDRERLHQVGVYVCIRLESTLRRTRLFPLDILVTAHRLAEFSMDRVIMIYDNDYNNTEAILLELVVMARTPV